jgi:Flp pilus assembly protein TadG
VIRPDRLLRNTEGVTIVEFAIVAPIMLTFIFGILDLGHGLYMQSVLQGAVQDAGRDAGIEGSQATKDAIDETVLRTVQAVMPFIDEDDVDIQRLNYENFSDVGMPEDFDDTNGNGIWDANECFTDLNGNRQWDTDVGVIGLGGADDVVSYTVEVTYDRLFPLWKLIGLSGRGTASASTVMRSQPFRQQASRRAVLICP